MPLFDSHCHLQDSRIIGRFAEISAAAAAVAVSGFLCCGSSVEDWPAVAELSEKNSRVVPAFGIHPWYVQDIPPDWEKKLRDYLYRYPAAIGEIGLDLKLVQNDFSRQLAVFEKQLQLAAEFQRSVSIHCVKAWSYLVPLLTRYRQLSQAPVQLHSYNGGPGLVPFLRPLDCYFSFSGSITRGRNKKAKNAIRAIPLDRILLETDSPDIPLEIAGQINYTEPNTPDRLPLILAKAAEILHLPSERFMATTWSNSLSFLRLEAGDTP